MNRHSYEQLRILITGSFCSLNNGDLAMVRSFINSLKERLPQADFTVLSWFPNIAPERYGVRVKGISMRPKMSHRFRVGWLLLVSLLHRGVGRWFSVAALNHDFAEYYNADLVVDLSGDGYSDAETPLATILHSIHLFPALMSRKTTIICAQSMGPFRTRFTRALARWILNRTDIITTREDVSKDYLREIGVKTPLFVTADFAFLLPVLGSDRIRTIMASLRIPVSDNPIIGISASSTVARWAFPEMHSHDQKHRAYIRVMARFSDYLVENLCAAIIYVPHAIGPLEVDDRLVQRDIIALMKHPDNVYPLEEEYLPEELKGIIGQCDLFIGARMHSLIAATSMGVPTIALAYSHKCHGVIGQMLDLDDYIIDVRQFDTTQLVQKLVEKTHSLWQNKAKIRTDLKNIVPLVQQRARRNTELLLGIINRCEEG